ncbi:MAG: pseudaminic acid synthase [Dissulfurimicrobium sp.]|uniref:pseudaminic acid synthase n=1 Tax=Dissulfurimicrobium sp. TaxID=2022436 RepID=UPI0040498BE2
MLQLNKNGVYIIAELSANHNQNLELAIKSVHAAAEAGADAIKLQTYTPDTITIDCDNEYFKINHGTIWDGQTLYNLYKQAYTPWEWHEALFAEAKKCGIDCFSTPFDFTAIDFLEQFNPPAYKIASFEIFDIPLIEKVAQLGKPVIISTGLATEEDITDAINACRRMNNHQIALLKCTSSYPAPLEKANLLTIPDMKHRFGCEVGLSDHTLGITSPIVAVALGARIIEKHFILDKSIGGPDAAFSLDKDEFALMVKHVREAQKTLGKVNYQLDEKAKQSKKLARSLFVVKDIEKGEIITTENIRSIRPGYGISPKYYYKVLGMKANKDLKRGTPLRWEDII